MSKSIRREQTFVLLLTLALTFKELPGAGLSHQAHRDCRLHPRRRNRHERLSRFRCGSQVRGPAPSTKRGPPERSPPSPSPWPSRMLLVAGGVKRSPCPTLRNCPPRVPLIRLMIERVGFYVKTDSPWKTMKEFMADAKETP